MRNKFSGLFRNCAGMTPRIGVFSVAFLSFILPAFLGSCSSSVKNQESDSAIEKAEAVAAQETALQMEAAKEGRTAAKEIVTRNWNDTMQLQQAILDARAKNSKYELEGKEKCKAAFDTAFYNTIRTSRPDLADQLKP